MTRNYTITNANIFMPDCSFHTGNIHVTNGVITQEQGQDDQVLDSRGLYVIPGLIDIHFHGCMGHDFCEGTQEALAAIANYETSNGITAICPATMTLSEEKLTQVMRAAKTFHESHPELVGINLEGPFISPKKLGAQNPGYVHRPDADMLARLQNESGGLIKIAVIAPEVDGGLEFIRQAKNLANLSIGHTDCDYQIATQAFESGANHVTHTYNAMNGIKHRDPGPILAALEDANTMIELICDGVHVHPSLVRMTLKLFGDDRVIFISDSIEATGMPDGKYMLGGQDVIKKGGMATLTDGKTIAGSVCNLMEVFRLAVRDMNVKLESAIKCVTINPARSIGIESSHGSIQPGKIANLVALDMGLNIQWLIHDGELIVKSAV